MGGQMPRSTISAFGDPDAYQRSIRVQSFELLVTAAGEFRSELTRIALHRLWMQRSRESLPRIAHSTNFKDRGVIFFLSDAQAPMHHTGMELPPGGVMFYSPGAEHYQRSTIPCRWASMSLPIEELAAAGQAIAGRDLAAPKVTALIRPPPAMMGRLSQLHAAAGDLAATAPEILTHPEVAKAIEQELVHAMVRCLMDEGSERVSAGHSRMPVMRRFDQVIEANPGKPLYIAEVCAAIGVPARTLRFHCLHQLGMGPHQYLLLRRMNLVRRALASADPASRTVTDIATEHGFWELGRFSVAFRKLFGESPSATLRRSGVPRAAGSRVSS
jgi:AraC-like DNA-binding protein